SRPVCPFLRSCAFRRATVRENYYRISLTGFWRFTASDSSEEFDGIISNDRHSCDLALLPLEVPPSNPVRSLLRFDPDGFSSASNPPHKQHTQIIISISSQ